MLVTRFDPFREVDRLLNETLGANNKGSVMPMDLYRTGDRYIIQCDLPGVDPGSVDVTVEDRMLTIRAKRSSIDEDNVQWLSAERPTGTFARQIALGRDVSVENIEADYTNGVLSLTLPVAEGAKPRRISVSQSSSSAEKPAVTSAEST